jgi:hypothetical protein
MCRAVLLRIQICMMWPEENVACQERVGAGGGFKTQFEIKKLPLFMDPLGAGL